MADPEINLLCSYFVVRVTSDGRFVMLNLFYYVAFRFATGQHQFTSCFDKFNHQTEINSF